MIALIPIGHVDEEFINDLRPSLEKVIGKRVRIAQRIALPWDSWNPDRNQHLSPSILAILATLPYSDDRVLGVTDVDIYTTGLNFIFGEADYVGGKALISLQRLRQEFYGLPSDEKLFQRRALKEAVHELGHTYGLGHCPDPTCVMYFSNSLSDTDFKEWEFCPFCQENVNRIV